MHELIWVLIVGFGLLAVAQLAAYLVVAALVVYEKRCTDFRDWFEAMDGCDEKLDRDTFVESGANVAGRIIVLDK